MRLDGIYVLLVEDDDDSRRWLGVMLKQHGAEVSSAASAADAFRLFTDKLPDVLVSDIGMPEEDGYELISKIRALPVENGGLIPAIALTGYATRKLGRNIDHRHERELHSAKRLRLVNAK